MEQLPASTNTQSQEKCSFASFHIMWKQLTMNRQKAFARLPSSLLDWGRMLITRWGMFVYLRRTVLEVYTCAFRLVSITGVGPFFLCSGALSTQPIHDTSVMKMSSFSDMSPQENSTEPKDRSGKHRILVASKLTCRTHMNTWRLANLRSKDRIYSPDLENAKVMAGGRKKAEMAKLCWKNQK